MPSIATTLNYYNMFSELFGLEPNTLYEKQAANVLVSKDPSTDITLEYTGTVPRLHEALM